jgi:cyclopropane fatty-acyl-phospholipid synthase-like methyltransferase
MNLNSNMYFIYPMSSTIEQGWDEIAPDWDLICLRYRWVASETLVRLLAHYLNGGEILDIGAGSGLIGKLLIPEGFVVDGTDLSQKMLDLAKAKGYRHLIHGDIRKPETIESIRRLNPSYDGIVASGVFGDNVDPWYLHQPIGLLREKAVIALTGQTDSTVPLALTVLEQRGFTIKENFNAVGMCPNDKEVQYVHIVGVR